MLIMREIALFSGKIYTVGTNFTRPSVVTVATNLNSGQLWLDFGKLHNKGNFLRYFLTILLEPKTILHLVANSTSALMWYKDHQRILNLLVEF